MRAREKSAALLAAVATTAAGLNVAVPAAAGPPAPEAVIGTIAGSSADVAELAVYVQPEQDIAAAIPLGGTMPLERLPASAVNVVGDRYEVAVRPQDLPDSTVGDTGLVTFELVARDADANVLGVTGASARAVYDSAGQPRWQDPLTSTEETPWFPGGGVPADPPRSTSQAGTLLGPVTADLSVTAVAPETLAPELYDDELSPPDAGEATNTDDAFLTQQEVDATLAASASCNRLAGAGKVKVAQRTSWATIGTGYPLNGDKSTMGHEASESVLYSVAIGMANDQVGYWEAEGTKSVDRKTGFDWFEETYARSYKVGSEMYKYAYYYDRCPPSPPYYHGWEVGSYSGTYGETSGINRPDWKTCRQFTSSGLWWRSRSDGKGYALSGGLKFRKIIGLDLSTARQYSTEAKLGYRITAGRWLCGNNGIPETAGKLMERLNDA